MISFLNNNNFFLKKSICFFLPGRNVMEAITKLLNYISKTFENLFEMLEMDLC